MLTPKGLCPLPSAIPSDHVTEEMIQATKDAVSTEKSKMPTVAPRVLHFDHTCPIIFSTNDHTRFVPYHGGSDTAVAAYVCLKTGTEFLDIQDSASFKKLLIAAAVIDGETGTSEFDTVAKALQFVLVSYSGLRMAIDGLAEHAVGRVTNFAFLDGALRIRVSDSGHVSVTIDRTHAVTVDAWLVPLLHVMEAMLHLPALAGHEIYVLTFMVAVWAPPFIPGRLWNNSEAWSWLELVTRDKFPSLCDSDQIAVHHRIAWPEPSDGSTLDDYTLAWLFTKTLEKARCRMALWIPVRATDTAVHFDNLLVYYAQSIKDCHAAPVEAVYPGYPATMAGPDSEPACFLCAPYAPKGLVIPPGLHDDDRVVHTICGCAIKEHPGDEAGVLFGLKSADQRRAMRKESMSGKDA